MPIKIVLEAGVNHNGSLKKAKKMIDIASKAGADFIKFQTFAAEDLVTKTAPMAQYQKKNTKNFGTQYKMLKRLELTEKDYIKLIKYCKKQLLIKYIKLFFCIEKFV